MYTITKEELGNRLKKVRLFLSITQTELKDNIGCSQVAISRMESGQGMAYELFIKTLCFYSQYIYIDSLFQEKFQTALMAKRAFSNPMSTPWQKV